MMVKNYILLNYGRVYNPYQWFYNPSYVVNRIYYIVSGTACYKDKTILKPGNVYVFNAIPDFRVSQSEEDPVDHIFFDFQTYGKLVDGELLEIGVDTSQRLKHIIEAIACDFKNETCGPEIAKNYLEIIMYYLQDRLIADNNYSEVTTNALKIIHNTPIETLSVNTLAEGVNRNVNHIIRCFKKDIGMTPHKYIAILKTNLAISYIGHGDNASEVAYRLGFGSLSSFSYFFKQATGKNYSEYKDSVISAQYEDGRFFGGNV
ncbi:MAG: helix-turn-helix transcriptional regulator [Lachnospiraceae bacterium]|nr:helix-turn-helix transcriptional regulator [Lachnospiraceae bacterium]